MRWGRDEEGGGRERQRERTIQEWLQNSQNNQLSTKLNAAGGTRIHDRKKEGEGKNKKIYVKKKKRLMNET